jgi:hypothetical protein
MADVRGTGRSWIGDASWLALPGWWNCWAVETRILNCGTTGQITAIKA